jgi:hypothetical protein
MGDPKADLAEKGDKELKNLSWVIVTFPAENLFLV